MKYVIIGNGIAGLSAAEEIRKRDSNGIITMISAEEYLTYYRVKLSHFINKIDFTLNDLLIHKKTWYDERNIDLLLNTKIINIDANKKRIIADDGKSIEYDKLLIANGSSTFIPPILGVGKRGVYALRTIDDLKEIQSYLKGCSTVSVIGGGLLGLEAAWALQKLNKEINIIEFFPYLLPRQLDEELGNYLKSQLEKQGFKFYLDAIANEIQGDGEVNNIKLKDGRDVKSDAVLISAGIRPNTTIVGGTFLKTDKGIVVNKYMKTNINDIFAAGDVAQYNGAVMGLWSSAIEQGKIAGANMVGDKKEYSLPEAATMLSIGDIKMFSVGKVNDTQRSITIKSEDHMHKLFIDNGKLVGGVLFGDIKKMIALKKAVNKNKDISNYINKGLKGEEILGII